MWVKEGAGPKSMLDDLPWCPKTDHSKSLTHQQESDSDQRGTARCPASQSGKLANEQQLWPLTVATAAAAYWVAFTPATYRLHRHFLKCLPFSRRRTSLSILTQLTRRKPSIDARSDISVDRITCWCPGKVKQEDLKICDLCDLVKIMTHDSFLVDRILLSCLLDCRWWWWHLMPDYCVSTPSSLSFNRSRSVLR